MLRQARNVVEVARKINGDPTQLVDQPAKQSRQQLNGWQRRKRARQELVGNLKKGERDAQVW